LGFDSFRLRSLFWPADPAGGVVATVAFRHAAYQELLAAEFLRDAVARDAAMEGAGRPRLTEQVRESLCRRSNVAGGDDGVLPAGVYVVGPGHHLMLRRVERPVKFDRFPLTVARYKRFLEAVARHGSAQWDHPAVPSGFTHRPWHERLRVPGYYDDPAYENHPAIAINWWSAYAFARFEGKRLPTSLEWEAPARGADGRLFPWGDEVDISVVNCADSWTHPSLITYEAWRAELDRGRLRDALPRAVDSHPGNRSRFGIRETVGNVWELAGTVLEDRNEAVICGGSFDNPYRAVQASSKGTYGRRGASNAVGFRCVEDLACVRRHDAVAPAAIAGGRQALPIASGSDASPTVSPPAAALPGAREPTSSATTRPARPTPSTTPTSSPNASAPSAPANASAS
jgi:Sulfatase-modifying factor enzyme 1